MFVHVRVSVLPGYYPPNHQLVIGTDPLDSFEELAELLGQAKPQTASKEEIDNSGLEVIRMSALAEYEKIGRVAPMCVDRVTCTSQFFLCSLTHRFFQCLICLEEYHQEEDLRLLSCRHVFHKDCVDRWLETGRNNCPACRTQVMSFFFMPPHTESFFRVCPPRGLSPSHLRRRPRHGA